MTLDVFSSLVTAARSRGEQRLVIPVARRLSADLLTPVSAFLLLRENGSHVFLLESVEGGDKLGRYSFLGKNPYRIVEAAGGRVIVRGRQSDEAPNGDIFAVLQHYLDMWQEVQQPGLPRLTCGAVGFLGYDNVRQIENLPNEPEDDLLLPDAIWCFYESIVAFDRVRDQLVLMSSVFVETDTDLVAAYSNATKRLDNLESDLRGKFEHPQPVELSASLLTSNFDRDEFEDAVRAAKRCIYEGDIFQVVLSQRFTLSFKGDPFNLYRALRQINPSPYLFYLDFGSVSLIGSSPEVLVRLEGGRAELLPIAGTRPRGKTPTEDAKISQDLLDDPKERAEHLMLVDLGRNDLGRVCKLGSVKVDRYAYIERYSHVMHIVSSLSGLLEDGFEAMAVLKACFPAGTVSGAPKVRAMEIIDALEPTKRGVYAGAVGYVDFSGNMDTCITIRTMVIRGGDVFIQAGAGIVADSAPAREFVETENKARALKLALLMAAEGLH